MNLDLRERGKRRITLGGLKHKGRSTSFSTADSLNIAVFLRRLPN